jgi:hypothetical protein
VAARWIIGVRSPNGVDIFFINKYIAAVRLPCSPIKWSPLHVIKVEESKVGGLQLYMRLTDGMLPLYTHTLS